MSEHYYLKLYVTGNTLRSQRAIANLYRFCEQELPGQHSITVIDVLENPKVAEEEKILITPTLVKEHPLPCERVIGDLSNVEVILFALNIQSQSQAKGS